MSGALTGLIGVIGDVHAEDVLLAEALNELERAGVERILCVGDIADGRGSLERVCNLLAAQRVATVRGNHDRWLLADRMRDLPDATPRGGVSAEALRYLGALPCTLRFSSQWGGVLLCHGLGTEDMSSVSADDFGYAIECNTELQALLADPEVQIVINGHTHRPMVRHFDGLTVVNAGTLFRDHEPGYVTLDFSSGQATWRGLGQEKERSLGSIARASGSDR